MSVSVEYIRNELIQLNVLKKYVENHSVKFKTTASVL